MNTPRTAETRLKIHTFCFRQFGGVNKTEYIQKHDINSYGKHVRIWHRYRKKKTPNYSIRVDLSRTNPTPLRHRRCRVRVWVPGVGYGFSIEIVRKFVFTFTRRRIRRNPSGLLTRRRAIINMIIILLFFFSFPTNNSLS